jgi:hypothetical protein
MRPITGRDLVEALTLGQKRGWQAGYEAALLILESDFFDNEDVREWIEQQRDHLAQMREFV